MLKRKNLYLIWTPIYILTVILLIKYLPGSYENIFLTAIIIFLIKDSFIDLFYKKGFWPDWSEHLPFSVIVIFLWFSGYVSPTIGLLALADSVLDFLLDQKDKVFGIKLEKK